MSKTDYDKAMFYIDNIVDCLNDIAIKIGHPTFDENPEHKVKGM